MIVMSCQYIITYSDEMIERSSLSTLVSNSYKPIVVVVVIMTSRGFATLPSQVAFSDTDNRWSATQAWVVIGHRS